MHVQRNGEPTISRCNAIRCTEVVICLACDGLAVYSFRRDPTDELYASIMLLLICFSFSLLTIVDALSTLYLQTSIPFKLWTVYAFIGACSFISISTAYAAMHSFRNIEKNTWMMLGTYFCQGLVFLLDGTSLLVFRRRKIHPTSHPAADDPLPGRCSITTQTTESSLPINKPHMAEPVDHAVNFHRDKSFSDSTEVGKSRVRKYRKHRTKTRQDNALYRNRQNLLATSYGGTFHMSRDVAPLPSPDAP